MNMRDNWTISENKCFSDMFYNREESIQSVKDNFDIRRYYTAEGYDIEINGVVERCLVQTSSNPLRELNDYRKIHCPINSDVKRGYYVNYEGSVWIIDTNVVNVDGAYLSTRMSRCQYVLRWQNKNGEIIERYGYSSDQTKYSGGRTGNENITIGDNQYGLLLPIDNETKLLKRGMRFAIDFDDAETPDVYELTNRKVKLNDETLDNRGGTMTIALSFDAFNPVVDKLVTLKDGKKVWICNYKDKNTNTSLLPSDTDSSLFPSLPNEPIELRVKIQGNPNLRLGVPREYIASITDAESNIIQWNDEFSWNIVSDFSILQECDGNKMTLCAEDEELLDFSFIIQILKDYIVVAKKEVTIVDLI